MPEHRNIDAKPRDNASQLSANATAAPVVASTREISSKLDPDILLDLNAAAMSADRAACGIALDRALATGIPPEDIADLYIPELARQMGDKWCSDELGFAGVTIGVSRLQVMLRDLGPDWSGDNAADAMAPAIMLIVAQDVYHTLGAMVLAGQLRRKGLSVRLTLGLRHEEIAARIRRMGFDAVFISASRGETLESLRRIVDVVKTATDQHLPIVIGGTILEVETKEDVKALTGADYATAQPDEAIQLCSLNVVPNSRSRMTRRT